MKRILLLTVLFTLNSAVFSQGWQNVGSQNFSTLDGFGSQYKWHFLTQNNDTLYLTLQDGVYGNKCTVMKYNGTEWVTVGPGGFSGGVTYNEDLEFINNVPYVCYRDGSVGYGTTVMSFDGTNWNVVGSAGIGGSVLSYYQNLEIINGIPYVAYTSTAHNGIEVMSFNGTTWNLVGPANFTGSACNELSMATNQNMPYIAYQDALNGSKASVHRYNGAAWELVGNALFSAGQINRININFDNNGVAYVAYMDNSVGTKITVMKLDAATWVPVGTVGFTPNNADWPRIEFDSNNTPYVSFQDVVTSTAEVMKFDGTSWVALSNNSASGESIVAPGPGFTILNDQPHIAYGPTSFYNTVRKFTGCTLNNAITLNGATLSAAQVGANYQWINCTTTTAITGATSQSFSPTSDGDYACIISVNGCVDTTSCQSVVGVGLDEIAFDLELYPNPASDKLFIVANEPIQEVSIYNFLGQAVLTLNENELDISTLVPGVYLAKIQLSTGVYQKQFVKL